MSGSDLDWNLYIDDKGNFELAEYLFRVIMDLMKTSLDFGTLLSDDQAKLRAFKEQTKSVFKKRWKEVAQSFEYFGIIVPCGCPVKEYCSKCGGARFLLNAALSPEEIREIATVIGPQDDPEIQSKLKEGLKKALEEVI